MREFYVGIMSGTSMDGIDLALVSFAEPFHMELIDHREIPFDGPVRHQLLDLIRADQVPQKTVVAAECLLGELFADAVTAFLCDAQVPAETIRAIGFHGITLHHLPVPAPALDGYGRGTWQIGNPFVLAQKTGIPVVFDFRRADMALGGQGAPLAPFLDHLAFRDEYERRILLNLGGIANLSFLDPQRTEVLAFDAGPANMVCDHLMQFHPDQPGLFDPEGQVAARGTVIPALLAEALAHPYFRQKPPKSTGREDFGASFCERFLNWQEAYIDDLVATAAELTIVSVADAVSLCLTPPARDGDRLIVGGGGAHNQTLMQGLARRLPHVTVTTTQPYGIPPDAKEAMLMASLAWAHVHGVPGNLPEVTGARASAVLGAATPGTFRSSSGTH